MDWSSEVHYPKDPSTSTTTASSIKVPSISAYSQQPRLHLDTDAAVRPAAHDPSEDTARPSNAYVHRQFLSGAMKSEGDDLLQEQEQDQDHYVESPEASSIDMPGLARPLTTSERENLAQLDKLKFFLATAPSHWASNNANSTVVSATNPHPALHRFLLPSQEYVSCVLWGNLYHITGTDIVRALVFRFEAFGRPVRNIKKFEEGVFSDLRNLKPGIDACLEEPKSPFLDLLFKHQSIRTQKKQKVFYWFSVPHDRLFLDALERDLKREKMGQESTTQIEAEPAASFTYDPSKGLFEQFCGGSSSSDSDAGDESGDENNIASSIDDQLDGSSSSSKPKGHNPYHAMFSLFEGSPLYKQRRKKSSRAGSGLFSDPLSSQPQLPYDLDMNRRYGNPRYRPERTAGELFLMQAKGELASQPDRSSPSGSTYGYPGPSLNRGYSYSSGQSNIRTGSHNPYPSPDDAPSSSTRFLGNTTYNCPLITCGKMFKFPEQLEKHLSRHALANSPHMDIIPDANCAVDVGQDVVLREVEGDEEGLIQPVSTVPGHHHSGSTSTNFGSDADMYTLSRSYTSSPELQYPQIPNNATAQWVNAPIDSMRGSPAYEDGGNDMVGNVSVRTSPVESSSVEGYHQYAPAYSSFPSQTQPSASVSMASTIPSSSSLASSSLHHPSHVSGSAHLSSPSASTSHQHHQQQHPQPSQSQTRGDHHHGHARSAPALKGSFDHDQIQAYSSPAHASHFGQIGAQAISSQGPHSAQPSQPHFPQQPVPISHPAHPHHVSHSQLSHAGSPYGVTVPLSTSPGRSGAMYSGYPSSASSSSSAASSVGGSPPMPTSAGYGHHYSLSTSSQPAEHVPSSHGGVLRRHRSMTPNLGQSRADVDNGLGLSLTSTASGAIRPMTANAGSSAGGEFSMMQAQAIPISGRDRSSIERDPHQTASSLGLRGRGYHPYAGGYSSRSHSVSTNGTSSGRSSPVGFAVGHGHSSSVSSLVSAGSSNGHGHGDAVRGIMRMNLEQGSGMYRTESPLSMGHDVQASQYGMEVEGADVMGMAQPRQMPHPGMYHRQVSHSQLTHQQQYQQYSGANGSGYYASSQEGVPAMM